MQNEYLDGFQCLLPQTKRVLPSYQNMIGKKYGDLTVVKLLRKNNRNVLDCLCKCGKHQYLYRWQLKDRLSCTNCGKYTQQYMSQKEDLDVQLFNQLKQSNENFEISYKYANDSFHKLFFQSVKHKIKRHAFYAEGEFIRSNPLFVLCICRTLRCNNRSFHCIFHRCQYYIRFCILC